MPPRTTSDLQEKLATQLKFLKTSVRLYDEGHSDEVLRIAVSLRVLFHQTGSSHSIISQLNLEPKMFDTSSSTLEDNSFGDVSLLMANIGATNTPGYFAPLSQASRAHRIPFKNWWQQVVLRDLNGPAFSRYNLVHILANKEGGAHVDRKVTTDYDDIKTHGFGITFRNGSETFAPQNLVQETMRQIAHETIISFDPTYKVMPRERQRGRLIKDVSVIMGKKNGLKAKPKPNEKCPCLSDLKYKKCHGFI